MMKVFPSPKESSAPEEFGMIRSATLVYHVIGAPGDSLGDVFFYAMSASGIPQTGSILSTNLPYVRAVRRTPKYIGRRPNGESVVRIEIEYQLMLPNTDGVVLQIRGGGSLTTISTSLDKDGNPIEVTHDGNTQRKAINVLQVQRQHVRETIENTNDPDGLLEDWLNHVNSKEFRGSAARTWLVANGDWEPVILTSSPKVYKFTWQLLYDPAEHTYTVAYANEAGEIPSDVVDNVGIKDIKWHPEKDFNDKFKDG
jgi:hypothetical protein